MLSIVLNVRLNLSVYISFNRKFNRQTSILQCTTTACQRVFLADSINRIYRKGKQLLNICIDPLL